MIASEQEARQRRSARSPTPPRSRHPASRAISSEIGNRTETSGCSPRRAARSRTSPGRAVRTTPRLRCGRAREAPTAHDGHLPVLVHLRLPARGRSRPDAVGAPDHRLTLADAHRERLGLVPLERHVGRRGLRRAAPSRRWHRPRRRRAAEAGRPAPSCPAARTRGSRAPPAAGSRRGCAPTRCRAPRRALASVPPEVIGTMRAPRARASSKHDSVSAVPPEYEEQITRL